MTLNVGVSDMVQSMATDSAKFSAVQGREF